MMSYEVSPISIHNNGVIATKNIEIGELIFHDNPCLWYAKDLSQSCSFCGVLLYEKNDNYQVIQTCNCGVSYCSLDCKDRANEIGHRWLCHSKNKECIAELKLLDKSGHLGLALLFYCQIAQSYLESKRNIQQNITPIILANDFLKGFFSVDYCRSIHACRVEHLKIDENIFSNIIYPAYYAAHLKTPLALIHSILSEMEPWQGYDQEVAQTFLSSEIFSASFFASLMGTFICNNLEIEIFPRFSGDELSDGADAVFGTGLFPLFSKLNHSCECNTFNRTKQRTGVGREGGTSEEPHSKVGSVSVYAARAIACGEEITTSYLRGEASSAEERRRGLLQYLFACACPLCQLAASHATADY